MKKLNEVTKEDAIAILSEQYGSILKSNMFVLKSFSCPEYSWKELSSKYSTYEFLFEPDRIIVEKECEHCQEMNNNDFHVYYLCYIKAHQLGYYVPKLSEILK